MSSDQTSPSFDDPGLRRALRLQLGKETAPQSLRTKVLAALDETETSVPVRPWRRLVFSRQLVGLAIAASVLIVVGTVSIVALNRRPVIELPTQLASAMAQQHEVCVKSADHLTLGAPTNDLRAISKELTEKLRIPVLVAMVGDDWKFEGARICPLGNDRAGHLLFKRGEQTLSVFSVPGRAAYWPKEGAQYQVVVDGHPIAGFVRKNNMYCIVGNSPKNDLTLTDLQAIRDRLEEHFSAG